MAISLNQEISYQNPDEIIVSGGVTSNKVAAEIVVSVNDAEGGITSLNENGTWSSTVSLDGVGVADINATVTYTDGTSETSNDLEVIPASPLERQSMSLIQQADGTLSATVYGPNGRGLYDATLVPDGEGGLIDTVGRGGASIAYTDFPGNFETIDNFRAAGPRHDTLNLSDTSLLTLAQVLHHTTMSDGSATIHTGQDQSVTLTGVTKQELATHPHDFVFMGGHTLS